MGTPTPAPQGEALCGLLAFLVFQKRFLDVLGPCSPGWGWHTPGTSAGASSLPSVPEGALLWPQGSAQALGAGGCLYAGPPGGCDNFKRGFGFH